MTARSKRPCGCPLRGPHRIGCPVTHGVPVALDRDAIKAALSAAKGHNPTAAATLGTTVRTLQRRLDALSLRGELAALAVDEGWPDRAARAREARKVTVSADGGETMGCAGEGASPARTTPRAYSTSVAGRNYVLHIKRGAATLCGRIAAAVNCAGEGALDSELCRACLKRRAARP